jgi:hypothetical protein
MLKAKFVIKDKKGDSFSVSIPFAAIDNPADIPDLVLAMAGLIQPITRGKISSACMIIDVDVSSVTLATPYDDSDIQERANFTFATADNILKSWGIPAVYENLFVPGGAEIDLTNADVVAFILAMEDGIEVPSTAIYYPSDHRGSDVTALTHAMEAWGRIRNRA